MEERPREYGRKLEVSDGDISARVLKGMKVRDTEKTVWEKDPLQVRRNREAAPAKRHAVQPFVKRVKP